MSWCRLATHKPPNHPEYVHLHHTALLIHLLAIIFDLFSEFPLKYSFPSFLAVIPCLWRADHWQLAMQSTASSADHRNLQRQAPFPLLRISSLFGSKSCEAKMARALVLLGALLMLSGGCLALNNGLSRTPVLGYNTWNCFGPSIDEDLIKHTADLLVELGLAGAGYKYLILDDAWSEPVRAPNGQLVGNKARFPSGMKAMGEYIHSKGLYYGIYSDAGAFTCEHYLGSRGHEEIDAQTWADWGVDYLKYDNCYAPASDWVVDRYTAMRDALNKTGRPIVFSMCEWGVADPWLWSADVGNSWRTTGDIVATWESILLNLDNTVGTARYAGPGGWNDPDMLEVGNGRLTVNEQRAHFALWALLKSPLLIGADLRTLSAQSLAILKAREVIAVNQDELGVAGDLIWKQGPKEIYAAPLADGSRAVALLNRHTSGTQYPISKITVHWEQLGLEVGAKAMVRDLYAERDLGIFSGAFTANVDLHDVAALKITPLEPAAGPVTWRPWHGQHLFAAYPEDNKVAPPDTLLGQHRRRGGALLRGPSDLALTPEL